MKYLFLLILFIFIHNPSIAKQKFYKWTDSNGTVHYSTKVPENQTSNEVTVKSSSSKAPSSSQKPEKIEPSKPTTTIEEKFTERRKQKEKSKIRDEKKLTACKKAKANLAKFQKAVRYRSKDKKTGEYTYLEDNQRESIIKESKNTIRKTCKK